MTEQISKQKEKVQETHTQMQRHIYTQIFHKNTKLKTIIYKRKTCKAKKKKQKQTALIKQYKRKQKPQITNKQILLKHQRVCFVMGMGTTQ